jgi:hypothetical protein
MAVARKLYYSTDAILSRFKPSLSAYFDVYINKTFGDVDSEIVNFSAYEAVIPGSSYETTQVFGDRQGITQTYANKRVYPPVDVSFYVDKDYNVIKFFERWMEQIQPNSGIRGSSYSKFNYPEPDGNKLGYKSNVIITKFERQFSPRIDSTKKTNPQEPDQIKYTLLNAYPSNIISLPVSYEQSNLLRTTVTFNYDLYSIEYKSFNQNSFTEINKPNGDGSSVSGPGGDSGITLAEQTRLSRVAAGFLTDQEINRIPPNVG